MRPRPFAQAATVACILAFSPAALPAVPPAVANAVPMGSGPPGIEAAHTVEATWRGDSSIASAAVLLAAPTDPAPHDDLDATSAPPWNPARPTLRRHVWEQAILLPQRIVSLPLSALGVATDRTMMFLEERNLLGKFAFVSAEIPRRTGLRARIASLGDRTGLGAMIEGRAIFLPGRFRNFVVLSHSASTRGYHDTEARLFGRPFGLEYRYQWRPQDRFYGLGMGADDADLSDYAVHTEHVRASMGIFWNKGEADAEEPRSQLVTWFGPRSIVTRRGREAGKPSVETRFPDVVAATLDREYEHTTYGVRFASDWRMGQPRWWEGWRVLLQAERFDRPKLVFAIDTEAPGAQFTRTQIELEGATSFGREPRTFRLLGRIVDHGITSHPERMEIFDLARLGGREGLRGFQPGRFHDRDLALVKLSYLFTLVRRLELDLHVETGAVFPDVWRATRLDHFEYSGGFAIRGRAKTRPLGAVGIDFSREGARLRYSLGNPDR